MLTILIFLITPFLLYFYFVNKYKYWEKRGVKYEKPLFLIGNLKNVILGRRGPGQDVGDFYFKFNEPYFGYYNFWQPCLVLKDPKIIKNVLIKDFHYFCDRPLTNDKNADPIAYNFLFGLKNPEWQTIRKKLSTFFSPVKLKAMLALIKECGEELTDYLRNYDDEIIEMKNVSRKFSIALIMSCAFGTKVDSLKPGQTVFCKAAMQFFSFNIWRGLNVLGYLLTPSLVSLFKLKLVEPNAAKFLKEVFWKTVKEREEKGETRDDFVQLLINMKNENPNYKDGDLLPAQAIMMFGAGFETINSAIAFTIFELCHREEIQKKVRVEIESVVSKHGGEISYECIQEMKYLDMVLMEALRKYPFAPFFQREAMADYKIPGHNLVIEKGTSILITQFGLHFDPKYFKNPEVFDPERFSDENKKNITPGAFLPFGDGPRNCVGERFGTLSTKIGLIYFLRNFEVIKCAKTPSELIFDTKAPILMPTVGLYMRIRKIK